MFAGLFQKIHEAVTDRAAHTFLATGTPTIHVGNAVGSIHVAPGPSGQVQVEIIKTVADLSEEAARRALEEMTVTLTQEGDTFTIAAPATWSLNPLRSQKIDLILTIPPEAACHLKQDFGAIVASGITGHLEANSKAGNIELSGVNVEGDSRIAVTSGNVTMSGTVRPGASLEVEVVTGNVVMSLPHDTPVHLEAQAHVGHATIVGWPIPINHHLLGVGAAGELTPHPSGRLTIKTTTGNIQVLAS